MWPPWTDDPEDGMTEHLHMEAEFLELRTRHPFIIARGNQSDNRTVWVRLRDAEGHRIAARSGLPAAIVIKLST